jgi:hypothetical protein
MLWPGRKDAVGGRPSVGTLILLEGSPRKKAVKPWGDRDGGGLDRLELHEGRSPG